jgi:TonB-linked SusC/RagA family outer membrane protein
MKKALLLWLIMAIGVVHAFAQSRTITGRVIDEKDGTPLQGVTVQIKGTGKGVVTDANGNYSIDVEPKSVLVFSFIGYAAREQGVGNKPTMNVSIGPDNKVLSEIVVTGYGEQKRKDVTASVTSVIGDKLSDRPTVSFDQALTGRAAGVNVATTSGVLGDAVTIRIRGVNSISNSNQPLIVLDGMPLNTVNNTNQFNSGNGTRYNPLADINPNDIQSVDVLKDAAAAALYGSRAAAGVIVITTKRGRAGTVAVNYNTYVGWSSATRLPKMLNGDDFNTIQNEKSANAGGRVVANDIDLNNDGQPDRTDWLKEVFQTGFIHNHQLSLSGGNEKARYYASGEYSDQEGVVITNRLRRGAARVNLEVTPKKWLKAGINMYASRSLNNGVLSDGYLAGATFSAYNAMPNVPVYNTTGEYEGYYLTANNRDLGNGNNLDVTLNRANRFFHPLTGVKLGRNDNAVNRTVASAFVEVEPIAGLKLTSRFGIDYLQNFEDQYSGPNQAGNGFGLNGLVQENLFRRNQWNWSNFATYTRTFNQDHNFSLTGGVEYQYYNKKELYTGQANLADSYFKEIYDGLYAGAENSFTGGNAEALAFDSYFGRLSYNYQSKYYFDGSFRADAFSNFGRNNRRGYFPGASIGWRISEESFFKGKVSFMDDLKLRASYGLVGNALEDPYAYRTLYGGGQYADVNGFSITQIGDPNLQWETSKKLDIGVDAAFFNSRINLTVDYFYNNIDNLILNVPVLNTTGIPWTPGLVGSVLTTNVGAMWNKGIEVVINARTLETKDFTWSTSFNFTRVKNKLTQLADPSDLISGNSRGSIGKPLGIFQLIRWGGVNPDNGNPMFYTKDGNLVMYNPDPAIPLSQRYTTPDGKEVVPQITANDAVYTDKSGYPTWYGGLDNTFTYKGFDLGIFLQYSGGNYVYNATRAGLMSNYFQNNLVDIKDRWTTPGQQTDVPKLYMRDAVSTQASTRWLEKGDFLRMREIRLGYNFPGIKTKLGLNDLRVYAQVQNAFVITGYKGTDPEANTNRQAAIAYGVDSRGVPMPRIFSVGLNVGF